MEELPSFEAQIAQMRLEAQTVSAVCTPEVTAEMNATIDKLVTRFQQLQQVAEQKKIALMEAAELEEALENSVQTVVAWTDTAQSLGIASQSQLESVEQVKLCVEEHKVREGLKGQGI